MCKVADIAIFEIKNKWIEKRIWIEKYTRRADFDFAFAKMQLLTSEKMFKIARVS